MERSLGAKAKASVETAPDGIGRLRRGTTRTTSTSENDSCVSQDREGEGQQPEHRRQVNRGGSPDEVVIGCKS